LRDIREVGPRRQPRRRALTYGDRDRKDEAHTNTNTIDPFCT
jgi:hypothetical protein